jgi:excisionase family DNA binding protein
MSFDHDNIPKPAGSRAPKVDPFAYPPRGLSREEAARYVGVGATTFDRLVEERRMPRPVRIGRRTIWDRLKLDAAFTDLGEDDQENVLDRAMGLTVGRQRR